MPTKKSLLLLMLVSGFWQLQQLPAQQNKFDYSRYLHHQQDYAMPSLLFMTLVMAAIGLAIVASIWLLKKVGSGRFLSGKEMTLKESLYLGNKTYLHLVQVRDKLVVIGCAPQSITTLLEMTISEANPSASSVTPTQTSPPFSKVLSTLIDSQANVSEKK